MDPVGMTPFVGIAFVRCYLFALQEGNPVCEAGSSPRPAFGEMSGLRAADNLRRLEGSRFHLQNLKGSFLTF
jgi:hypothetical protein